MGFISKTFGCHALYSGTTQKRETLVDGCQRIGLRVCEGERFARRRKHEGEIAQAAGTEASVKSIVLGGHLID